MNDRSIQISKKTINFPQTSNQSISKEFRDLLKLPSKRKFNQLNFSKKVDIKDFLNNMGYDQTYVDRASKRI